MNRRHFAKAAILTPIAIALRPVAFPQEAASPAQNGSAAPAASVPHKRKTAAAYNKHRPILEPAPFADKLVFQRNPIPSRVEPFSLREVQIDAGPLEQAREWNRAYMMRLPSDRLLHNFRVNAGSNRMQSRSVGGSRRTRNYVAILWAIIFRQRPCSTPPPGTLR